MARPRLVDEPTVHEVGLEVKNDPLRSIERALAPWNGQVRLVERDLLDRSQNQDLLCVAPEGYVRLDTRVMGGANWSASALLGMAHGSSCETCSPSSLTAETCAWSVRTSALQCAAGTLGEVMQRRPDGSSPCALVESRPVPGGSCLTMLTDIGERKRTEEALSRANQKLVEHTHELTSVKDALEKALRARAAADAERNALAVRLRSAESLGLLAGGIAHDLNNLLVGVVANADLLLETAPDLNPVVRDGLTTIKGAARGAADLARQLVVNAGRGKVSLRPVQLNLSIRESLRLLQARVPQFAELRAELAPEEYWINADASQIQQVVSNLVINALEALGDNGGSVVVRTRLEQLDAEALARFPHRTGAQPGHFAILEVEDAGMGIDTCQMTRIFEPFFTSKSTGHGLGLASVCRIVRSHNAAMSVRSALCQGSTFEIAWPLAAPFTVSEASFPVCATAWDGSAQALLVDDDPGVRHALARQFGQLGFVLTQAGSSAEALELFRAQPHRFRLAVIDRCMPGLSGDRLIQMLHELVPALPVVLVSGYNDREPMAHDDRIAFVAKPMTLCDLRRAVAQLFEAQSIRSQATLVAATRQGAHEPEPPVSRVRRLEGEDDPGDDPARSRQALPGVTNSKLDDLHGGLDTA